MDYDYETILEQLEGLARPGAIVNANRIGITPKTIFYGAKIPELRKLARDAGTNHQLAQVLWQSNIHDARILATMIADPEQMTETQMEQWVKGFDSWDLCDQCCLNLFSKTNFAYNKVVEWSSREEELVKRAAFALMATLAIHDRAAMDKKFIAFMPIIMKQATDERLHVKKAVCWALRQIGKRNPTLNQAALETAEALQEHTSRAARWIAGEAMDELTSSAVKERLGKEL